MNVEKCKGFKDLTPQEMQKFRLIEGIFRDTCKQWGYQEIKTPTLEYLYLFTSAGTLTPGMLGRVYSFLDWDGWSGERVVLKPDGTIPVARFYIENQKKGLARLFYVTNIFIYEETGKKTREKWQCGAELIGENSVIADGELIALALDATSRMGLSDVKVILSHAGLIRALIEEIQLSSEEKEHIFNQILDGDLKTLVHIKKDKPELVEVLNLLLKIKGKSPGLLKNIKVISAKKLPRFKPGLNNFISVVELLEEMGCDYRIDLASGKGFEYYTGIIFHLSVGKEVIGGGGRYDELVPLMGGRNTPAAGFAIYMDNLLRIIGADAIDIPIAKKVLASITLESAKEGFKIANMLRKAGMMVELALYGHKTIGFDWFVEINAGSPTFVITNLVNGRKYAVNSADDVQALLGSK